MGVKDEEGKKTIKVFQSFSICLSIKLNQGSTTVLSLLDAGRKLNTHETFKRYPKRLLNVTPCVQRLKENT